MKKIAVVLIVIALALTICSCTGMSQEVQRIEAFAGEVAEVIVLTQQENVSPEQIQAKAEELTHPSSSITVDSIVAQVMTNEKAAGIDPSTLTMEDVVIGSFATPQLMNYNESLGGNVYELDVTVTVKGVEFQVSLTLLSNDAGMGIYAVDIK